MLAQLSVNVKSSKDEAELVKEQLKSAKQDLELN